VLGLSRSQLLVYGALAVALLLLGVRWIRSAPAGDSQPGPVSFQGSPTGGTYQGSFTASGTGSAAGRDLIVDVAGEVRRPGVYRLPEGSRVTDAIDRAGGATGTALLDAINLAAELADGQQVVVPARSPAGLGAASAAGTAPDGPISLGSATVEQLDTIEGIGPVTAQNIVDYRDQEGGVSSVEDLDQISGIGPATMEALRARLQP
jgi:competence protein ComEA